MTYPEAPPQQPGDIIAEQDEVITFYRGCTRTRANHYFAAHSPRGRIESMITQFNGQFHLSSQTEAIYFSRNRDVAKDYAIVAEKRANGPLEEQTIKERVSRGCSCGNKNQKQICTCLLVLEAPVLLRFEIPKSWFWGLKIMVWDEACERWVEWIHRNRTNDPHPEKFADYDGAHVVEGPLAEAVGFHLPGEFVSPYEARPKRSGGKVVRQTCFKGPALLEMLGHLLGSMEEL